MKAPTLLLALGTLLSTAHAQTPATTQPAPGPKPADQRATAYKGPKVVKDSKALGRKMIQKSKPTDTVIPVPAPVKQ